MKIIEKRRRNSSHKPALMLWAYILWCDIMTLSRYDRSQRAMALRFLRMGIGWICIGTLILGVGIVTLQPSACIFGAIALGIGIFAFCIGLLYIS